MEAKIDALIKTVNEIKSFQNKLLSSVNSLSEKLSSLTKKVNDLSSQLSCLSSEFEPLKTRVENIEIKLQSTTAPDSKNMINNELISEIIDRQNRLKNTLLFNIPETNASNNQTSDFDLIKDVLKFLNIKSTPTQIIRLGKLLSTSIKPRPLKLCFPDQQAVFDIFSSQAKLKSNPSLKDIRFSSDRTKQQQNHMSSLRQELLRRKSAGELDIIIKYVRGNPTIINSKNY